MCSSSWKTLHLFWISFTAVFSSANTWNIGTSIVSKKCPSPWSQAGDSCYRIFVFTDTPRYGVTAPTRTESPPGDRTWRQARLSCMVVGSDLVSINSDTEAYQVDQIRKNEGIDDNRYYWIGLQDAQAEGHFRWVDGSNVTFSRWKVGEPTSSIPSNPRASSENFVVSSKGQWQDVENDWTRVINGCNEPYAFICERPLNPVKGISQKDSGGRVTRILGIAGSTGPPGLPGAKGDTGLRGPRGHTGPRGQKGEAGSPGRNGKDGAKGMRGEKGLKGTKGDQGPPGLIQVMDTLIGPNGAPGKPGPQGIQGKVGPIGPKGQKGERGFRGSTGPVGSRGPKGARGDQGLQGTQGPPGQRGLRGPTGAQGPRGHPGARGRPGPEGREGPQGPKGSRGQIGPRGGRGFSGPVGPVGPRGPMGIQGLTGASGEKGDRGTKGMKGETGPRGQSGEKGDRGQDGVNGLDGMPGIPGAMGPPGDTGPKGDRGRPGINGLPGMPGIDGLSGPKGDPGDAGPRGHRGPSGKVGPPGPPGPSHSVDGTVYGADDQNRSQWSRKTIFVNATAFCRGRPSGAYSHPLHCWQFITCGSTYGGDMEHTCYSGRRFSLQGPECRKDDTCVFGAPSALNEDWKGSKKITALALKAGDGRFAQRTVVEKLRATHTVYSAGLVVIFVLLAALAVLVCRLHLTRRRSVLHPFIMEKPGSVV